MIVLLVLLALFRPQQGASSPSSLGTGIAESDMMGIRDAAGSPDAHRTTRELSDIIVSCLATIFACTWTAIHPNIPGPYDSRWTCFKRRLITTIYALLAPEFVTVWALNQFIGAREIASRFNRELKIDPPESIKWYEYMKPDVIMELLFGDPDVTIPSDAWTTTHGFLVQMGGFMLRDWNDKKPIRALKADDIIKLVQTKDIHVPRITEAQILDHSKGDSLSKTIVILQTTWFIAQCIARWATHLPVSELEILTLGFAALNATTYMLWWKKPQSVATTFDVYLNTVSSRGTSDSAINSYENWKPRWTKESRHITQTLQDYRKKGGLHMMLGYPLSLIEAILWPLGKMMLENNYEEGLRVPMFNSEIKEQVFIKFVRPATALITTLFGAIHLIPSFFLTSSSHVELQVWRAATVMTTALPILSWLMLKLAWQKWIPEYLERICTAISAAALLVYIVTRIVLICVAFMTLQHLPSEAKVTIDWISFIPHL